MAPSMQSVDSSSYGSVDQSKSSSSSPGSTFLFKVPTLRPRRQVGPDFGTERLRPEGAGGKTQHLLLFVFVFVIVVLISVEFDLVLFLYKLVLLF